MYDCNSIVILSFVKRNKIVSHCVVHLCVGVFSGCTMDWFLRWPREALIQVASHFLSDFTIRCADDVKKNMVEVRASRYISE